MLYIPRLEEAYHCTTLDFGVAIIRVIGMRTSMMHKQAHTDRSKHNRCNKRGIHDASY